jgi:sugar/nucleoside kinase (ribokinase family)
MTNPPAGDPIHPGVPSKQTALSNSEMKGIGMGILVVGSVALDSVKTPFGCEEEILGGSATHFSVAASYFTQVSMVAAIGDDFPEKHVAYLQRKGIDTSGLQRQRGRTFRWKGEYGSDFNTARTLETQLNVFADFSPRIREEHRQLRFVFLGNIDPDLQRDVVAQMQRPGIIVCDTMNYWIEKKRESLVKTLSLADVLIINDAETRQLAEERNLLRAVQTIRGWGLKTLVVKRGEYGVLMSNGPSMFGCPAYPVESVIDPTGAGDSFAGGFCGYLAAAGKRDDAGMRKAVVFGSVMASFTVSEFGTKKLGDLTYPEIEARFREFRRFTCFEDLD